jgi:hypothetical protein
MAHLRVDLRAASSGTVKLTGVLRRPEKRRCRFEHPRDPRSMGLFRRLVPEALAMIAVENGGPNLKQKMGAPLRPLPQAADAVSLKPKPPSRRSRSRS